MNQNLHVNQTGPGVSCLLTTDPCMILRFIHIVTPLRSGNAYMSAYFTTGSGSGLAPVQHQAITWTNVKLLSIGLLAEGFNRISIKILFFRTIHLLLKILPEICEPFCLPQYAVWVASHVSYRLVKVLFLLCFFGDLFCSEIPLLQS